MNKLAFFSQPPLKQLSRQTKDGDLDKISTHENQATGHLGNKSVWEVGLVFFDI